MLMTIKIRVKPNSKTNAVKPNEDGSYAVSLTTTPIEGKANAQLIRVLADHFGVAKSRIAIRSGQKSRDKLVIIE